MSAGDLYACNHTAVRRAKQLRTKRLRPIREALVDMPCSIRMHAGDSEKVFIANRHGCRSLEVDLREPFDLGTVLDFLHDAIDAAEGVLAQERARVFAAEERLEAGGRS